MPGKVQHKLFWARYFYKVHLIEKLEARRQVLKKRAEQTKVDSDSEINWDEDEEDLENVQDIPGGIDKYFFSAGYLFNNSLYLVIIDSQGLFFDI